MAEPKNAFDFSFTALDGTPLPLEAFCGRVLLIVNTASKCGFTPQYEGLESLWRSWEPRGVTVIGVPCNQFGNQEPDPEAAIAEFCQVRFGVTFPLTTRTDVTGEDAHPFYKWAAEEGGWLSRPKWNFHKYLINRDGSLADWFSSITKPESAKVTAALEKATA